MKGVARGKLEEHLKDCKKYRKSGKEARKR